MTLLSQQWRPKLKPSETTSNISQELKNLIKLILIATSIYNIVIGNKNLIDFFS